MAAYTSTATGNWSGAIWTPAGTPGDGDTFTIAAGHTVTITDSRTVGLGGAAGTTAGTLNGDLTIAGGGTLLAKGDILNNNRTLRVEAGGTLRFFAGGAGAYGFAPTAHVKNQSKLVLVGVEGDPAIVETEAGGNVATIGLSSMSPGIQIDATWGLFRRVYLRGYGYGTISGTWGFKLVDCTLDTCPPPILGGGDYGGLLWVWRRVKFINTTAPWGGATQFVSTGMISANTVGERAIEECFFDVTFAASSLRDFTVDRNVFGANVSLPTTTARWPASMADNIYVQSDSVSTYMGAAGSFGGYFVVFRELNPHCWINSVEAGATGTFDVKAMVEQVVPGVTADGDFVVSQTPNVAGPQVWRFNQCLILKNQFTGNASCNLVGTRNSSNDGRFKMEFRHNTVHSTSSGHGIYFDDLGVGYPGEVPVFENNLFVGSAENQGPVASKAAGTPVTDILTPAGIKNNGRWLIAEGSEGGGFNTDLTGTFGVDYGLGSVEADPQFMAPTRGFASWGASKGTDGTPAAALALLQADPSLSTDLISWVRAGYAPTNAVFEAANDGVAGGWMGAEEGTDPVASSYTLTGPSGGVVYAPSSNFTVTPVGGAFTGTIAPSDGGAGGTFEPPVLSWTAASDAKTFTYTPSTVGARTISTSDSSGLTDPSAITYTSRAAVTVTSAATGNASAGATWVGGVAPSPGDNVRTLAAHTVTFDQDMIFGDMSGTGIDGTLAFKAEGPFVVSDDVTLTLRGHASNLDVNGTFGAGSRLVFDTPNSSTNWLWTNGAIATNSKRITFAGTSGSRCRVESKAGGGTGAFKCATTGDNRGSFEATYTDFVRVGSASVPAIRAAFQPGYLKLDNCRFLACGLIIASWRGDEWIYNTPSPVEYGTLLLTNVHTIASIGRITGSSSDIALSLSNYYAGTSAATTTYLGISDCDFQNIANLRRLPSNFPLASTIFRDGQTGDGGPYAPSPAGASAPWPYRAMGTTSAPVAGGVGVASTNFTVALVGTGTCTGTTGDITVTPSDGGGGTFTPATVTLNDASTSATFTYTPATSGTKTISISSSPDLLSAGSVPYLASDIATSYELAGPSAGIYVAGRPVTCTVRIPTGTTLAADTTITPSDGASGTFSPTTVTLTNAATELTFTYTPVTSGTKTVSVTNDQGLTNPPSINLTARKSHAEVMALWDVWSKNPDPTGSFGADWYASTCAAPAPLQSLAGTNHYDPLNVFLRLKEHAGGDAGPDAATYDAAIDAARYQLSKYVLPNNGATTGYYRQSLGFVRDWERNGNSFSLRLAALMGLAALPSGGGAAPLNLTYADTITYSREVALLLATNLCAERIGVVSPVETATSMTAAIGYAEWSMNICDDWVLASEHPLDLEDLEADPVALTVWIQPFMVGITCRALIAYYEATGDARVPAKVKAAMDAVWDACWYPDAEAFPYYDRDLVAAGVSTEANGDSAGQPLINSASWILGLMNGPAYAWLAQHATDPTEKATYQQRFEDVMRGSAVKAAENGLWSQKEYNEQFYWSLEGVKWYERSFTPLTAATTYTLTARVASCRAEELGIELVVALPANTSGQVTITPSDDGDGGSFVPTSIVLHTDEPVGVFRYAPAAAMAGQTIRIETTNDKGLTDPASVDVTATTAAPLATGIALTTPVYQATKVGWSDTIFASYSPAGAVPPRSLDTLAGFSIGSVRAAKQSTPTAFTLYYGEGLGNFANGQMTAGASLGLGVDPYPIRFNMEPSTRYFPSETGILVKVYQAGFESPAVALTPGTAATSLAITGPSSVGLGETATFTITPNGPLEIVAPTTSTTDNPLIMASFPVTVTPSDGGAGGTFSPTTLTWTGLNDPKTVVYTPPGLGTYSITTTNNADPAVADPSGFAFSVNSISEQEGDPMPATAYTITGPTSGTVNQPVTLTITPNGVMTAAIALSDGANGTFDPPVLSWVFMSSAKTVRYTPVVVGTRSITSINTIGLPVPGAIAFTVAPVAATTYTFAGPMTAYVDLPAVYTVRPDGAFTGTITPAMTPSNGTFSPTSLTWAGTSEAKTFTYTPATDTAVTLSVTDSGSLTDPAAIEVTTVDTALAVALSGSAALTVGAATTYTVTPDGPFTGHVDIVAQSAPGSTGTLSTSRLTWAGTSEAKTFTYTPAARGPVTVLALPTSTVHLSVPVTAPAAILGTASVAATTYLLTGPATLPLQQSGTFVVSLPAGVDFDGDLEVTPSVSGGTGTFSPTTVTISMASPSATFLYTPTNGGTHTIDTTNDGSLTPPSAVGCAIAVKHRGQLITVGTEVTLLAPQTTDRRLLFFQVRGAGSVYLGGPNVTENTGIKLDATATPTPIDNLTGEAWYGVATTGTVSVYVHWI